MERTHRTIANIIRAKLHGNSDKEWPSMLPGIMLHLNSMNQEQHGYSAAQIMWGLGMNLPVDLTFPRKPDGHRSPKDYPEQVHRNLKRIREEVQPFNSRKEISQENPFQEGDKVLIYQQIMEREHKFSPK